MYNLIVSWLGDFWEFFARLVNVAPGHGQMRAAAFVRFTGASGLGHVGWGFDFSAAAVSVGSVENPSGTPTAPIATMGYWNAFLPNPLPTMAEKGYASLKYVDLPRANPVRALRVAKWVGTMPYDVLGRNCLDDTYDVLRAYGVADLQPPSEDLLPDAWFGLLHAALQPVSAFNWTRSGVADLREHIARAMARFAPLHVPTWRRRGNKDALDLQEQIDADKARRHAKPEGRGHGASS